jgi:hypothetical protein
MRRRSLRLESPRVFRGSDAMNLYPTTHHWTKGKIKFEIDGGGESRTTLIGPVYTSVIVSVSWKALEMIR